MSQVTIARRQAPEHGGLLSRSRARAAEPRHRARRDGRDADARRQTLRRRALCGEWRSAREARATREVIVSGGAINSPKLLELSGIGQGELLRARGITPVHELPRCRRKLARPLFAADQVRDQGAQSHLQRQCAGLAAGARGAEIRTFRDRIPGLDRGADPHLFPHARRAGNAGCDDLDPAVPVRDGRSPAHGLEAAGHHHERQRAALGEHRIDPHQIGRSRRAAGDPLQLPLHRA